MNLMKKLLIGTLTLALTASVGVTVAANAPPAGADTGGATLERAVTFDADSDAEYSMTGGTLVKSYDGSNAVRLQNSGSTATQYIDFGAFDPHADSFSISAHLKVPLAQSRDKDYCAILGTKSWSAYTNPGFMLGTSSVGGTFRGMWVDFSTADNKTDQYSMRNMPNTDGRWHAVTVTFDRNGAMSYYLDNVLYAAQSVDISALAGKSALGKALRAGADADGKYGVLDTTYDNIKVYMGVATAEQIALDALPLVATDERATLDVVYDRALQASTLTAARADRYVSAKASYDTAVAAAETAADWEAIVTNLRAAQDEIATVDEDPALEFVAFSDTHVDGGSPVGFPHVTQVLAKFGKMMNAIGDMYGSADAMVIPGDFTKNGKAIDFDKFTQKFALYNPIKKNVMISLGNHETKGFATIDKVKEQFDKMIATEGAGFYQTDSLYYDNWVNGYHFINLSTESVLTSATKDQADITQTQLDWFEQKLSEKAEAGKPIFVSLHQPLANTHQLSAKYPVGAADAKLKEILKKYPQAVLLSGHLHNGVIDETALVHNEYGYQYDLPSMWQNDLSNQDGSYATAFKVYADRTVIETFHYEDQRVMHAFTKTIWHSEMNAHDDSNDLTAATASTVDGAAAALTDGATDVYVERSTTTAFAERDKHIVTIDLGEAQKTSGLRVFCENITAIDVEYSLDGKTWLAARSGALNWTATAGWKTAVYNAVEARYLRLIPANVTPINGAFVTRIAEIKAIAAK